MLARRCLTTTLIAPSRHRATTLFNKFKFKFTPTTTRKKVLFAGCIVGAAVTLSLRESPAFFASGGVRISQDFWVLVQQENASAVRQYLDQHTDVDINKRHFGGWTPLMVAASRGDVAMVQLLLEKGASVHAADENNQFTPVARNALPARLTPNSNTQGWTALFYATISGSAVCFSLKVVVPTPQECIEVLISAGADPTVADSKGRTALDIAKLTKASDNVITALSTYAEKVKKQKQEEDRKRRREYPIEQRLMEAIVGQYSAILQVASAIRRKENGWIDADHPLVMLFLGRIRLAFPPKNLVSREHTGSSGIGKTETAKRVAKYLHGDDPDSFIRIDMSEYMHKHEVSKFIGSPPGYVGHDSGGQLTEKLKKKADAVVLLDEVDKAHPDVLSIMLQAFDEGRLTDGKGNTVHCKDAVFIMTTNLCQREIADQATKLRKEKGELTKAPDFLPANTTKDGQVDIDSGGKPQLQHLTDDIQFTREWKRDFIQPLLRQHFGRDEFLGRINEMVFFIPFTQEQLCLLAHRELQRWKATALKRHAITLKWDNRVEQVLTEAYDMRYGARSIQHEIDRKVVSRLAKSHVLLNVQFRTDWHNRAASEEDKLPDNSTVEIFWNSAAKDFDLKVEPGTKKSGGWNLFKK